MTTPTSSTSTPVLRVRHSEERGVTQTDWLDSRHTFSFGDYHDPQWVQFGPLRVINEDWVAPLKGFDFHGHRHMEILTYIVSGQLEHQDSLGNGEVMHPGTLQRMSAGTGIMHREWNPSDDETVHLLQMWILPASQDVQPGYETLAGPEVGQVASGVRLVASPDGAHGSLKIHQRIWLLELAMSPDHASDLSLSEALFQMISADALLLTSAWVQVVKGEVSLEALDVTTSLTAGDGVGLNFATAPPPRLQLAHHHHPARLLVYLF
jgi:quercetin 2,3-dioxygenase